MGKRIPHGTTSGYGRHKCRCEACTTAHRERMRVYYAKRKAEGRPTGKGRPRYKNFSGVCEQCGSGFQAEAEQQFCSRACFGASKRRVRSTELVHVGPAPEPVAPPTPVTVVRPRKGWGVLISGPCDWCGEVFIGLGATAKHCSRRCSRAREKFRRGDRFLVEPRLRYAIYQRDDWTCQLCFEAVDRDADPWSDWFPSLDHIVPQSRGGSDEWDNLRLTHRWCNAIRGDGRWHSDFFKVVTEGGALRVRPDGRSTEDLARSA